MRGEALLFYDDACRLCSRAVLTLRAWDRDGRIAVMPYASPLTPGVVPDVSRDEMSKAMLLLGPDGRRYLGADALPHLLALLPGGLPFRLLFEIPGMPTLARRAYRWIAGHRHDLGCALPEGSTV